MGDSAVWLWIFLVLLPAYFLLTTLRHKPAKVVGIIQYQSLAMPPQQQGLTVRREDHQAVNSFQRLSSRAQHTDLHRLRNK